MPNKITLDGVEYNLTPVESEQVDPVNTNIDSKGRYIEAPKYGTEYWYISSWGVVGRTPFKNSSTDCGLLKIGNCFATEEACQKEADRRQITLELERLANKAWVEIGEVLDWNNPNQVKHLFAYNNEASKWETTENYFCQYPLFPHFPTNESAKAAIETIGGDRLKLLN